MRRRFLLPALSVLLPVFLAGAVQGAALDAPAAGAADSPPGRLSLPSAPPEDATEGEADEIARRLVDLLDNRDGDDFWHTVSRLERLGEPARDVLVDRLATGGEKTRLGCAKALLSVGDLDQLQQAISALRALAAGARDVGVRVDAIELYGAEADPEEALSVLEKAFEEAEDPEIVIPLSRTLWELDRVTSARDRLVGLLGSRDPDVKAEAALTLAEIGYFEGDVGPVLRSLKKEPTERGRRANILDRLVRLSRRLDEQLVRGNLLLEGTDPAKLLEIKEARIRELEERLELMAGGRGGAGGVPVDSPGYDLLEEVIGIVQEIYVDPSKIDREALILSATKGLIRSLDEHSLFMDAEESRSFQEALRGEYAGIGAQVTKRPNSPLEVVRAFYGGPAYQAGLHSGDQILEVDALPTAELKIEELVQVLKGAEGTKVTLKVWRRSWPEPREMRVDRRVIEVPSAYWEFLPAEVGYIRLTQFGDRSAEEFIDALRHLEEKSLRGLIIDLRMNGGGRLDAAVRITDLFVSRELPIVTLKGRGPEESATESIYPTDGARKGYAMAVLVDEYSASASEVVAGALQDHGRAKVVGRRTFGKGSVQKIFPVRTRAGSRLKLTVQYYFLPLGRCIHTERDDRGRVVRPGGVEPDVVVENREMSSARVERRLQLRGDERVLEYVDKHWERLRTLIPFGDQEREGSYPEFEALRKEVAPRTPVEDLQAIIRYHVRRRLEDERGREVPFDLEEDTVLQRGILTILDAMGVAARDYPEYAWLPSADPEPGPDAEPEPAPEPEATPSPKPEPGA